MSLVSALSQNLPTLSSADIEAQVAGCDYRPLRVYDDAAERNRCPPFVVPFYYLMAARGEVPLPGQCVSVYFETYPEVEGYRKGLAARILRAWPSLVRDQHLVALLREAGMNASYSLDWDVSGGIDISVWPPQDSGRPALFVHAFVQTRRAVAFRQRKANGKRHFDLPLLRSEAQVVGGVWLYQRPLHTERVRVAL